MRQEASVMQNDIIWYKRQKSKWCLNFFKKPFDFWRQTTRASSNLRSKLADCECCIKTVIQYFWRLNHNIKCGLGQRCARDLVQRWDCTLQKVEMFCNADLLAKFFLKFYDHKSWNMWNCLWRNRIRWRLIIRSKKVDSRDAEKGRAKAGKGFSGEYKI